MVILILDNTLMLMMLMMQNPNADLNTMLPFLVMDDGKRDMKSLFLLTTVMQNNCHDTNDQMNMLLPLLLLSDDNDEETTDRKRRDTTDDKDNSETLMTLLLLQTMSQGNRGLDMNVMLPFLLMDDASDKDNLFLLVLVNSMTGGMDTTAGFDNNFNLLLPLLLIKDDDTTADDNKESDSDMLFILMAMQSQAPGKNLKLKYLIFHLKFDFIPIKIYLGTAMSSNALLPLLLMDSSSNNEPLIMFMAMMGNQQCGPVMHIAGAPVTY